VLSHFFQRRATGEELDYAESLYRTLTLMAMSFPDDLPRRPALRVVVRLFNQRIAEKIARNFNIRLVFSPSALAAPSFAAATAARS